jgi:hypothetical protein
MADKLFETGILIVPFVAARLVLVVEDNSRDGSRTITYRVRKCVLHFGYHFLRSTPTFALLASEAQHSQSDGTMSSALVPVIHIRSVPSKKNVWSGVQRFSCQGCCIHPSKVWIFRLIIHFTTNGTLEAPPESCVSLPLCCQIAGHKPEKPCA